MIVGMSVLFKNPKYIKRENYSRYTCDLWGQSPVDFSLLPVDTPLLIIMAELSDTAEDSGRTSR